MDVELRKKGYMNLNGNLDRIEKEKDLLLKRGVSTVYGGGFLLISYYLQINLPQLVKDLSINKEKGIPVLSAVLGIVNLSIFEEGRISDAGKTQDAGLPVLCGLAKFPDPSFFYRFLSTPTTQNSERFIAECGRAFIKTGLIKGRIVNIDGKFLGYFGKKKIAKTKRPTRNISMPGINVFCVQDQVTENPIFVRVKYPGLKPAEIVIPLLEKAIEIIGEDTLKKVVWDRWFSVGALLDYVEKVFKIKYVTIIRLHKNRIKEMKEIPVSEFETMAGGKEIAFKFTSLRNYDCEVKLVVIHFKKGGEDIYYGYLTNDTETPEKQITGEYRYRWRVENLFKEADFLGFAKLPSTELNEVTTILGIKSLAYNIVSSFRRDLPARFSWMELRSIYKEFLREQCFVQAKGKTVHVTFYGQKYEEILGLMYSDLSDRLNERGINPRIPWLGNRVLEFHFK